MLTWNLVTTFTLPLDPKWDELVSKTLGTSVHPSRREGFLLSRMALQDCFKTHGIKLGPSDLELDGFSQLKKHPLWKFSLTHCKGAGAAILSTEPKIIPGIDLEPEARVVSESVLRKVSNPDDVTLRKIELWCVKEAAFKSLMNTGKFESNVHFADIIVRKGNWIHSPSGLEGKWTIQNPRPFVLALSELEIETSVLPARDY